MTDVSRAIQETLSSPNVADSNLEPANVVDVIDKLAVALRDGLITVSPEWHQGEGFTLVHVGAEFVRQWQETNGYLARLTKSLEDLASNLSEEAP